MPLAVPLVVALDEIALSDFYSRLIVNADGTLNVQHVARETGADPGASSAAAAGTSAPAGAPATPPTAPASTANSTASAGAAAPGPPPVTINRVTLTSARVNFSDRFVKPN